MYAYCITTASKSGYLASPSSIFMSAKLFIGPPECETKVSYKKTGMGYVKMHGFHGKPLCDSREWGIGLQIELYLGFYLS